MSNRAPTWRYVLFLLLAVCGCVADLATKSWVFSWPNMHGGNVVWLWTGHAGIQLSLNEGALFGMGHGNVWLFALVSIVAAVAIPVWLFALDAARDLWLTIALGCVMGGILGNLYDRLGLPGLVWTVPDPRAGETVYAVRDWILLQWNDQWIWPNFNIADSLLVVGAAIIFVHAWRAPQESASSAQQPSGA